MAKTDKQKVKKKKMKAVVAAAAEVTTALPAPPLFIAPQLPAAAKAPPEGKDWLHEIKHDGWRVMARIEDGKVRLMSRGRNNWTQEFRLVAEELSGLGVENTYLDGEIIVPHQDPATGFFRTSAHEISSAIKWEPQNIHYAIFDLLYLNGEDLRPLPLTIRKERLQTLLENPPVHLLYVEHLGIPGRTMLEHAYKLGAEGIVSKRADSGYHSGRSQNWIKVKRRRGQPAPT